ncbi:Glycosyl transferases group 1 [Arthrobacter sp. 9AX]|uniref:glycosyltransferase family 4 protein n=1 Tax=Arthrobacter sp. 9AX TaxID=2653131 RepID=UPI0012F302D4|nr:glycosyltransferase family 4 protein [Arthrobacter sp. 9AX]VXC38980.1 Glycosyl transferases group 1 [Arthrobacter sp. 9AX]
MRPIRLLVPANIRHNSGGNVYNARLVAGLRVLGTDVEVLPVEGSWPESSAKERRRLGTLLGAWEPGAVPGTAVTIVDGLIAMGAPDPLEFAAKAGRETWVLVHMPAPANYDLEARSLRAASGIICTSTWAAKILEERHGLRGLHVALPGADAAALAEGSAPPHIITVAALLPNKDQLLVVEALARLQDLEWTASLVGSDQADPDYAGRVRESVAAHGLGNRVRIAGELKGQALEEEWNRADLSVLVSKAEAFGMVVTESLAHGIPVIVRAGTGAVEALGFAAPDEGKSVSGTAVHFPGTEDSENPALLAEVLRNWLQDRRIRDTWRAAALETRTTLPGWDRTAIRIMDLTANSRTGPDKRQPEG